MDDIWETQVNSVNLLEERKAEHVKDIFGYSADVDEFGRDMKSHPCPDQYVVTKITGDPYLSKLADFSTRTASAENQEDLRLANLDLVRAKK